LSRFALFRQPAARRRFSALADKLRQMNAPGLKQPAALQQQAVPNHKTTTHRACAPWPGIHLPGTVRQSDRAPDRRTWCATKLPGRGCTAPCACLLAATLFVYIKLEIIPPRTIQLRRSLSTRKC